MCAKQQKTAQGIHWGFTLGIFIFLLSITGFSHSGWLVEDQKLTASDGAEGNGFGKSVAVSGDTAVVGAWGGYVGDEFPGPGNSATGWAYVFVKDGGTWIQQAKLTASDAAVRDHFGYSVAISEDTIVVGAHGDENEAAGFRTGSAYVFTRDGNNWIEQAKLTASDADINEVGSSVDEFGSSVAVSGETVVVGAYESNTRSGSVYVFTRSGSLWSEQAKVRASDATDFDQFGYSVAISGDTLVSGAKSDNDGGYNSGSAYIFTRNETSWSEQMKLTASDAAARDEFGYSVDVSGDTVVVGAHLEGDGGVAGDIGDSGSAYVFVREGTIWSEQATLKASDAAIGDHFGGAVVIAGNIVMVGAIQDDDGGNASGSAYIFTRSGSTWNEQAKLTASDAEALDGFGGAIAVSGETVIVGAVNNDEVADYAGSAYVFDLAANTTSPLPSNQWRQISLPGDPGANNSVTAVFGETISGMYGADADWVLYRYDTDTDRYAALAATDPVIQGVGYWIIQITDSSATLALPNNSTPIPVTHPTGCLDTAKGCFEIPLATEAAATQWNMISYPFGATERLGDVRVLTNSGTCISGCELIDAQAQSIVHDQLWTFNGTSYALVNTGDNLDPWTGYWAATLGSAEGSSPRLLVPKPLSNPPLPQ